MEGEAFAMFSSSLLESEIALLEAQREEIQQRIDLLKQELGRRAIGVTNA